MFKIPVDVRVNTVNCKGVMGAGVALAFKNRYPEMFKDYKKACQEGLVRPGLMHVWKNLYGDWVINFPTKRDWREPSRYEDILDGLEDLRRYLQNLGPIKVALPALGCGHGGLDWNKISTMINEKLDGLDAHIFVFEPADSRNAGRVEKEQLSDKQISELEDFGFKSVELPVHFPLEGSPSTALVKGEESLLTHKWIALLPSKNPTEKELMALDAVARQMASGNKKQAIALVYSSRSTEKVVEIYLKYGVPVVMILPFGPLTRKSIARTTTDNLSAPFALLSTSAPSEAWGRPILAKNMSLLRIGALSVLITDPAPDWINHNSMKMWTIKPVFYLRYDNQVNDTRRLLDREGARPIGRKQDSGEPNLAPVFLGSVSTSSVHEQALHSKVEHVTISSTTVTPIQLRELANEIDKISNHDVNIQISVSCSGGNEDLQIEIRKILTGCPSKK